MLEQLLERPDITMVTLGGIFVLLIVLMLGVIIWQRNKVNELIALQRPVTGFLGKPLASFAVAAIAITGFAVTYFVSENTVSNPDSVFVSDSAETTFDIITQSNQLDNGNYNVRFSVSPRFGGIAWANPDATFDVYWAVSGPQEFYKFELDLNADNKGGFVRELPGGVYFVELNIIGENQEWKVEKTFTL